MKYLELYTDLKSIDEQLKIATSKAININLTIRNWLFGFYIVEYEQNGKDRAQYGQQLLERLARELAIKGLKSPELSRCRQFYKSYPEIFGTVTQKLINTPWQILGTVTQELQTTDDNSYLIELVKVCSFSHFVELIKIQDQAKRQFYELLILKTTPSVRELKRQIESLAFERLGLSQSPQLALGALEKKIAPQKSADIVKSHYLFDFLNLRHDNIIEESDLEQALLDHLQEFILELGDGFCFEARQKRLLIGDEYYHVDLVFYHRILKCHVLIDLKTQHAKHENIGQLKTYVEYYKRKIKLENDNPPVGLLLVTGQNKTLVEYAIADSDKELFVSEYLLKLPTKKQLLQFIENELKHL